MAYGNVAARHRLGLSARACNTLHQWALARLEGYTGRHEDLSWPLVAPHVTCEGLLAVRGCGQAVVDEIARALRAAGHGLPGHAAADDGGIVLARGSSVRLAGRARPLVVADYAVMGDEVLVRLRPERPGKTVGSARPASGA